MGFIKDCGLERVMRDLRILSGSPGADFAAVVDPALGDSAKKLDNCIKELGKTVENLLIKYKKGIIHALIRARTAPPVLLMKGILRIISAILVRHVALGEDWTCMNSRMLIESCARGHGNFSGSAQSTIATGFEPVDRREAIDFCPRSFLVDDGWST
ncbi:unnamed protein product [Haemonchus placei]|uniref:Vinculin n=1 Tax=Haemonchus placei TaxID=6290 RepID=A0A0N4W554_HAEPC|nr:unnamed protein product [Haemonchus placei]